jgi:hypothetical protein
MSLQKTDKIDKIEIVGDFKAINIRVASIITENDIEISRSNIRRVLNCDADISEEDAEVQAICNAVWTDEIKAAYETFKESQTNP